MKLWFFLPLVLTNLYIPLKNFRDTQYYSDLQINNQTFSVIMDTGSSNIWIPSSLCETQGCLQHSRYNVQNSTQYLEQSASGLDKFEIVYGTGKIEGVLLFETIQFQSFSVEK